MIRSLPILVGLYTHKIFKSSPLSDGQKGMFNYIITNAMIKLPKYVATW